MGRRCTVCEHPERALIEAALSAGTRSKRRISARFNVTEQALRRHIGSHLERSSRFIGRARELAELDAGLREAAAGKGRLYLIVGEPGIGKSTLLEEIATRAAAHGFATAWGRCWEAGGAPTLWPWTQVVRAVTELDEDGGTPRELTPADDEASRFQMFSSVAETLRAAAGRRPVAVLLDDVHAADRASLLLLAFAAAELRRAPVVIAATYRDVEARRSPELARTLSEVARSSTRLPLVGLDPAEVARLVELIAGAPQTDDLVSRIHAATAGNPFFVDEVVRLHLTQTDDETLEIPEGVRDAIRATLGPLDDRTRGVLEAAAVTGRRFEPDVVAAVCGADLDDVVDTLLSSGVVVEARTPQQDPPALEFSHALVRETVYEDLRPGARVQLHRCVGEVLEARPDADSRASELAFHFFNAAPAGSASKAVDYAKRAGDRAMDVLAYEDAAEEYGRALQALGLCEPDEPRRCDLLIDLGQALLKAGTPYQANRALRTVTDAARRLGDAERFAAAVRHMSSELAFGAVDDEEIRLIDEALSLLPEDDSYPRSSLLGRLGRLAATSDPGRAAAAVAESVAMARRIGDPNALANALVYALSLAWAPDALDERRSIAEEIVAVSPSVRDRFLGLCALTAIHLERADRAAVDVTLRDVRVTADRLMQPRYTWQARVLEACIALLDARFDEADALAASASDVGRSAEEANAALVHGAHVATSHHNRGRLGELADAIAGFAEAYPSPTLWTAALALAQAFAGQQDLARRKLDRLDPAASPKDGNWLLAVTMGAEAAYRTGATDRARELHPCLAPYAGRVVVVAFGAAAYGPVDLYLGMLAAALADLHTADKHFTRALEISRRMGAPAWEATVLHEHGRALLREDRARGAELLADAADAYGSIGLTSLAASAQALAGERPRPVAVAASEPLAAILKREGSSWRVVFEGAEFRVRDSHGMRYLAWLLARPGREAHVLDLVSARSGGERLASGDAGEAIDPAARVAYRARIEQLRDELSDAEDRGDADGVARAQEEIDAIARELSSSLGLGGRSRKAASEAERARLNVTRAIRTAIRAIEGLSASLGRYLETTIATGTFCAYEPDARFPVAWEVSTREEGTSRREAPSSRRSG